MMEEDYQIYLSDCKMAYALGEKQCTILQRLEMHMEAIQRLVKCHGQQEDVQELGSEIICDNNECENSAIVLTIAAYVEHIRQVINEGKNSLPSTPGSPLPQTPEDESVDEFEFDPLVNFTDACEKAFNNSVVLRKIMNHLDTPDLLRIRSVAKKWEEEATAQLLSIPRHNKYYKVAFQWDDTNENFQNKVGTLQEFTESCYGNPLKKFPCSQFYFLNVTTEDEIEEAPADLSNFLSNHGHTIKNLCLHLFYSSASDFRILRKLIFQWTPHLESLTLHLPWYAGSATQGMEDISELDHNLEFPTIFLEDLQELIFDTPPIYFDSIEAHGCSRLVRDILSAAPNFRRITDPGLWFVEEILSYEKITAIQSLELGSHLTCPKLLDHFVELSRAGPQLTSLEMGGECFPTIKYSTPPSDFFRGLQHILESSRHTLKTCLFHGRLDLTIENSRMTIPVMENLEELYLVKWSEFEEGRGRILPPGFSIQDSFPRLKTLTIEGIGNAENEDLEDDDYNDKDNPFGTTANSSTSVETLNIIPNFIFHPEWLDQARVLYPNVQILHLLLQTSCLDLVDICRTIWKSWHDSLLEELHIVLLDMEDNGNLAEKMDEVLTGFDGETCRMLREQKDFKNCQGHEEFEPSFSILDMKSLKLFQLTGELLSDGSPIFSPVSRIHALDPMRRRQKLRVVINEVELDAMTI